MNRLIQGIVVWLVEQGAIPEDERELYEYSVRTFFITIVSITIGIVMGTLLDEFLPGLIFVISFMLLRRYSGGYHARSFGKCMCYSCILLALTFLAARSLYYTEGFALLTTGSAVSIWFLSPVASPERGLTDSERQENKRVVRMMVLVYGAIILSLLLMGEEVYVVRLSLGIILTAVLQIPCIRMKN